MPLTLTEVTRMGVEPGTLIPKLIGSRHYIRLKGALTDAPVFIQDGQVFGEGGERLTPEDLPEWFHAELAKCAPAALSAVGWQMIPARPVGSKREALPAKEAKEG